VEDLLEGGGAPVGNRLRWVAVLREPPSLDAMNRTAMMMMAMAIPGAA